jgi:hypothetical protein
MDILPSEINEIQTVGTLYNQDVKMVVTNGGFFLCVGKKTKTSRKSEALAGGSHAGIVVHQLQKEFGSDFQPAMAKNESERLEVVENKSEYLPKASLEKGVELFTLSKNEKINFVLYKQGLSLGQWGTEINGSELVIKKPILKKDQIDSKLEVATALSRAIKDKAHELNLKIRDN